jgi:RNA polymerase sigma-70 factor (ECF subfamily)
LIMQAERSANPGLSVSDEQLVERYLGGQRPALEELLRRHRQSAYRVAIRRVGQDADALDAVQEGFAKACRALPGYQRRGAFKTWLLRVVENAAHDVRRRRDRGRPVIAGSSWLRTHDDLLPTNEVDPALALEGADLRRLLDTALADLSSAQRRTFTLHALDGLTYREVAERLGVPIGTVMSRLHHARRKLRTALAGQAVEN